MERREEQPQRSAKLLRQRKFLLVAPVLILPFVVILLWTFGWVGEAKGEKAAAKRFQGLNLNLPSAAPAKDSNWNKLKYYEQADKDSAKLKSLLKNDPFRRPGRETGAGLALDAGNNSRYRYDPYPADKQPDANEERVYKKLAALNRELETAAQRERQPGQQHDTIKKETALHSTDVDRLESMMHAMQQPKEEDAEMKQYQQMLETILDIQNPQRVQKRLQEQSEKNKRQAFTVDRPQEDMISLLEPPTDFSELLHRYEADSMPAAMRAYMASNRFYSLEETAPQAAAGRSIAAAVPEDQTLVSGSTIKLRLLEDVFIAGVRIPKDHFVYGLATLNGERLQVSISSIEYRNYVLPVALSVYDKKDGMPGISIPGAITRDVAKKSAGQSMQGLGTINTLDPSIGAQAVTAGLTAAQNLIGKSARLVRVTVEAGYPVLLKDDNRKDK